MLSLRLSIQWTKYFFFDVYLASEEVVFVGQGERFEEHVDHQVEQVGGNFGLCDKVNTPL